MHTGLGGMWLDDQSLMDQLVDDWLAAREMLGLSYGGDITKEPEVPPRTSKTVKRLVERLSEALDQGRIFANAQDISE